MRSKPLVLVVDDDKDFLDIMLVHLRAAGFEPSTLQSWDQGEVVAQCERLLPDVMLLDIYLSDKPDGIDIALAIRKNPKTKRVKVLFWSSLNYLLLNAMPQNKTLIDKFAPEYFLDKTEDLNTVTRKIQGILSKS